MVGVRLTLTEIHDQDQEIARQEQSQSEPEVKPEL
jgi:hypothetical protein